MIRLKHFLLGALALPFACACAWAETTEEKPVVNSPINAELFYQLLVGEISAREGDVPTAYVLMLDAARKSKSEVLFERAVELALRARSGESALQGIQAWLQAYPGSAQANRYQLQVLIGLNRISETVEPIQRELAALAPGERLSAITLLPRYFAQVPDKKAAAKIVEQALAKQLSTVQFGPAAWSSVGRLLLLAGDKVGALDAVRKGQALNVQADDPLYLALDLLDHATPEVDAVVRKYLANKPAVAVRMAYVRKLVQLQRYGDALAQAELVTAEQKQSAEAWLVRGSLEFQVRRFGAAETSLTHFLGLPSPIPANPDAPEMDPGHVQAYFLLSQIAEHNLKYAQAMSYLDRISGAQYIARVQTRRANVLAREGKLEEGRALIRAIPETRAEDAREKVNAEAQLLREAKAYKAAHTLLSVAITNFPGDLDFLYDKAMIAERLGRFDEMESLLRKVIASKPDYYHAYNALGYSLADRNVDLPQARKLIGKALEFAPNDPFILDSMAWLEFRSSNNDEAIRLLQSAYQARPDAEIAAHLGEVLWASGQAGPARAIWDEGKKLNPDNETLLETIRRVSGKK